MSQRPDNLAAIDPELATRGSSLTQPLRNQAAQPHPAMPDSVTLSEVIGALHFQPPQVVRRSETQFTIHARLPPGVLEELLGSPDIRRYQVDRPIKHLARRALERG